MKRFILYDTVKQVWAAIKQTYSDGADEAKIYDLHKRSFIMNQADASVAKYYSELTEIFQELDQLSPSPTEHPKDIETRDKEVDVDRLRGRFCGWSQSLNLRQHMHILKEIVTAREKKDKGQKRPEPHLHLLSHPRRLHQNLHKVHLAPRPWPPQVALYQTIKPNTYYQCQWHHLPSYGRRDLLTRTVIGCGTRRGNLYYLDLT
ncbi:unnamed protein product [Prunus armeniaca]